MRFCVEWERGILSREESRRASLRILTIKYQSAGMYVWKGAVMLDGLLQFAIIMSVT